MVAMSKDYGTSKYLGASPMMEPVMESSSNPSADDNHDSDEALMDLAQLEDLHNEAERMKALGNKHMAAQVRSKNLATFLREARLIFRMTHKPHPVSIKLSGILESI
jgi:hypothetical protein